MPTYEKYVVLAEQYLAASRGAQETPEVLGFLFVAENCIAQALRVYITEQQPTITRSPEIQPCLPISSF